MKERCNLHNTQVPRPWVCLFWQSPWIDGIIMDDSFFTESFTGRNLRSRSADSKNDKEKGSVAEFGKN